MKYDLPITPGDTYENFLRRAMDVPLLSVEDELELIESIREDGCKKSRHHLFLANTRLVVKLSKIYKAYGLNQEDLIQEGLIGLMKALDTYKPEKGLRFGTYATGLVKAEMIAYLTANLRSVRIITNNKHKKLFFNIGRYKRNGKWLSAEERQMLADELNVSVDDVRDMEGRLATRDANLLTQEPDDDYVIGRNDVMPLASEAMTPDEQTELDNDSVYRREMIQKALSQLTSQEMDIIMNRFMVEEDRVMTLVQLADRYGLTRERIRQIEAKALKKLSKNQALADVA